MQTHVEVPCFLYKHMRVGEADGYKQILDRTILKCNVNRWAATDFNKQNMTTSSVNATTNKTVISVSEFDRMAAKYPLQVSLIGELDVLCSMHAAY